MSFWEKLTLESSTAKQRDEFIRKYRQTFLWLTTPTGVRSLVLFSEYNEELGLYYLKGEDYTVKIAHNTKAVLEGGFPSTKLINSGNTFLWFCRIPARQYKKGVCSDNCIFYSPVHNSYWASLSRYHNHKNIEEAFCPTYYDYDVAVEMLKNDKTRIGVAMDSNFALSLHPVSNDKLLLWYQMYQIAEINNNVISVFNSMLQVEVQDFLRKNRIYAIVEVIA